MAIFPVIVIRLYASIFPLQLSDYWRGGLLGYNAHEL